MKGNQFVKDFHESFWEFGDQVIAEEGQTDATIVWQGLMDNARANLALTYEQRTANLLTFYNTHSLYESLDDADRYAIQKELLQRLGVRGDA